MAEFKPAFDKMLLDEGGLVLHKVDGDRGGLTYGGIARNANPHWPGWGYIDRGQEPPAQLVFDFYRTSYWELLHGDEIESQRVADSIFNFGVNAGVKVGGKLAQAVVGVTPDGVLGPQTIAALNRYDENLFVANYSLAKIARYAEIARKNPTQRKFLLGWILRTLRGVA